MDLDGTVSEGWDSVNALVAKKREAIATYGDPTGAIQNQIDRIFWLSLKINGVPSHG